MRIKKISLLKMIFCLSFCAMFFSRIQLLTGNYPWKINALYIEILYLGLAAMVIAAGRRGRIRRFNKKIVLFFLCFLGHTVLWGKVFVNPAFPKLTVSQFSPQIVFDLIILFTVLCAWELDAADLLIRAGYGTLVFALLIRLFANIQDFNLSNVANLMHTSSRSRVHFGFGHYNTLGEACVCALLIDFLYIRRKENSAVHRIIHTVISLLLIGMLLCSASRSAITGIGVFFYVYTFAGLDKTRLSNRFRQILKAAEILAVMGGAVWTLLGVDLNALLIESQRFWIFTSALPEYFRSGRILTGLGYVSTTAYGTGLTPYHTLWIDNAYFYYLIATGILGFALIFAMFFLLGKGLRRADRHNVYRGNLALYAVYLYCSLFEVLAFNSGIPVNYIYLPLFLLVILITDKKQKTELTEEPASC